LESQGPAPASSCGTRPTGRAARSRCTSSDDNNAWLNVQARLTSLPCGAGLAAALKPRPAGLHPCGQPSLTRRGSDAMGCFIRSCASVHSRRSPPTFRRPCSEAKNERVNSYVDDQIWGLRVSPQSPEHDHREFARTHKSCDDERGALRPRRSACVAVRRRTTRSRMGFFGPGAAFYDQPARGSLRKRATFGFAYEVTAPAPGHVGAYRAGMVPAPRSEPYDVAQSQPRP
jgi:hypothetical protein